MADTAKVVPITYPLTFYATCSTRLSDSRGKNRVYKAAYAPDRKNLIGTDWEININEKQWFSEWPSPNGERWLTLRREYPRPGLPIPEEWHAINLQEGNRVRLWTRMPVQYMKGEPETKVEIFANQDMRIYFPTRLRVWALPYAGASIIDQIMQGTAKKKKAPERKLVKETKTIITREYK